MVFLDDVNYSWSLEEKRVVEKGLELLDKEFTWMHDIAKTVRIRTFINDAEMYVIPSRDNEYILNPQWARLYHDLTTVVETPAIMEWTLNMLLKRTVNMVYGRKKKETDDETKDGEPTNGNGDITAGASSGAAKPSSGDWTK